MRRATLSACVAFGCACVTVPAKEPIGRTPPPSEAPIPKGPVSFDFDSLDDRSVSAPALRGKPLVLAFVRSDTLAGQAQADILTKLAEAEPHAARYAVVAVEPADRRELVEGFVRFFTDKTRTPLLGAMADAATLKGDGPFGDVRGLTVVVLDATGRIVMRRTGVVPGIEIARALSAM